MDCIIPIIDTTTIALEQAAAAYDAIKNSNQLKISFHQAGEGLATVISTLNKIKCHIESGNQSGDESDADDADDADTCIRTCCDSARYSKRAFETVASGADQERLKTYRIYLKHQGKEYRVEVLVRGMMINTCELAKHVGADSKITSELKSLRWSIKKFDKEILKQDEEDKEMRGTGGATHSGIGDFYHAKDDATQNNIKDHGTQYFASSGGGWPQKEAPA